MQTFDRVFTERGLHFERAEINAPMGMEKRAHLRAMLSTDRGRALWQQAQGRPWTEADIEALYQRFEEALRETVAAFSAPLEGVAETVAELRARGLKIGSTTGYNRRVMELVLPVAAAGGYAPDCTITPDDTGLGRPSPFMVHACMQRLGVWPAKRVVKVGDTVADIREGKNAGAWAIGLLTGSNLLGLTRAEAEAMAPEALARLKCQARNQYLAAGADAVIDHFCELPATLRALEARARLI